MTLRPFDPAVRGRVPTAAEFQRLQDTVYQIHHLYPVPPIEVLETPDGRMIRWQGLSLREYPPSTATPPALFATNVELAHGPADIPGGGPFVLTTLDASRVLLDLSWGTVWDIEDVGIPRSAGTSTRVARADHRHDMSSIYWPLSFEGEKPVTVTSGTFFFFLSGAGLTLQNGSTFTIGSQAVTVGTTDGASTIQFVRHKTIRYTDFDVSGDGMDEELIHTTGAPSGQTWLFSAAKCVTPWSATSGVVTLTSGFSGGSYSNVMGSIGIASSGDVSSNAGAITVYEDAGGYKVRANVTVGESLTAGEQLFTSFYVPIQ